MSVFRLSPSILNSFVQGYEKDALASFYGRKFKGNEYTQKGSILHELLGFNNKEKFSYTFNIDNDYVELVGIVDWIDKKRKLIKELKTLNNYSGWIPHNKILGGKIQLQAYLMAYDYPFGELVFVDASDWEEGKPLPPIVKTIPVFRNDEKVIDIIKKFIDVIQKQSKITYYVNRSTLKHEIEG